MRGLTAAQALNQSLKYSAGAFKASAIVNQALLGTQPHDLSGAVQGNEEVFRALASRQNQLASLVTTFDSTMARAGRPPAGPERDDRRAAAAAAHGQPGAHLAGRLVRPDQERSRRRSCPSLDAARPDDRAGAAVARAGHRAGRAERARRSGRRPHAGRPADRERAPRRRTTLLSQSDTLARCVDPQPGPDRQRGDPGSPADQRRARSTRSCSQTAVGLASAGAELRRQRPLPALDAGRRLDPGADRQPRVPGAAVRQRGAPAARHPPGLARPGAAGQEQHGRASRTPRPT